MKYRTKKVQLRQKISVVLAISSVVATTSLLSAHAIKQGDIAMALVKAQLSSPTEISAAKPAANESVGLWVTGDSVILGIRHELEARQHISLINARVGRQAPELIAVMTHDKLSMTNAPVIFNLGNNNRLTEAQVLAIFTEVENQPKIIVVNTAVPRDWRDANNILIAKYALAFNATLVDWNAISHGHPEYFAPDGVHLVPAGVRVYVEAISEQL